MNVEIDRNSTTSKWETIYGLPAKELSQSKLKARISSMAERYVEIASRIPAPLTLHLGYMELWNITGWYENKQNLGVFMSTREAGNFPNPETFELDIRNGLARARHRTRSHQDLYHSKNSERELKPAEELFDKLFSPLEEKMGISKP